MTELMAQEYIRFEDIKHTDADGAEYWSARELAEALEYTQWRNFTKVIEKAMIACEVSDFNVLDHFADVSKMIEVGKGGKRKLDDYELSRYACYLIVQNGDPRKEVIAQGQTYFAMQTHRQEIADRFNQLDEDKKRLIVRGDIAYGDLNPSVCGLRNCSVASPNAFAVRPVRLCHLTVPRNNSGARRLCDHKKV